jgi:hypothetical protein
VRTDRVATFAGLLLVAGWAALLTRWMGSGPADYWSALLVATGLLLISVPLVARAARADGWRRAAPLLWTALVLKLLASCLRYWVAFHVYGGSTDSLGYHKAGSAIADGLWHGRLTMPMPPIGTEAVEAATGVVYTGVGPTLLGGYLVFGWLALWGCWMCYRALRIALPQAATHRYAVLVLLLPSLLYWPSSIGKEALMLLGIGAVSLGAARLTSGSSERGSALLPLLGGLLITGFIRPHVAVLLMSGVFLAYVVRRPRHRTLTSPISHALGLVAAGAVVLVMVSAAAKFLHVDEVNPNAIRETLEATAERTATGGSEFTAQPVTSVADMPGAIITVVFRPWPWEAHNAQALTAAAESVLLLLLMLLCWRRVVALPRLLLREPYVAYVATYVLLFVYAFSTFGNFGLLVRERVQVLPLVLVLPCLPLLRRRGPAPATPVTRRTVSGSRPETERVGVTTEVGP